jgi:DNA-binding transcriptional regulator YiaG
MAKKSPKPGNWRERLKLLRLRLGMNQLEFAEHIGVTSRTLADWEMGYHIPSKVYRRIIEAAEKKSKKR